MKTQKQVYIFMKFEYLISRHNRKNELVVFYRISRFFVLHEKTIYATRSENLIFSCNTKNRKMRHDTHISFFRVTRKIEKRVIDRTSRFFVLHEKSRFASTIPKLFPRIFLCVFSEFLLLLPLKKAFTAMPKKVIIQRVIIMPGTL